MSRTLHIVCLDVPYPPDYGGVFDLFYKIKYLAAQGAEIVLHCFEYGRGRQPELEKYCKQVYYYPRQKGISPLLPYIVSSRRNSDLIRRLSADTHPVILEGIHCTYYLHSKALAPARVWVRLHNVEFEYYRGLARAETSGWKRLYFLLESILLKRYEQQLCREGKFLCVSEHDADVYRQMGASHASYFPIFLEQQMISGREGHGSFCLYHGNLAVSENEEAALFLISKVFDNQSVPFKIAGKNPTARIRKACKDRSIELIENPNEAEMNRLLHDAHIHLLPSFNATGIKIKLVQALFKGRFVITNSQGVLDGHIGLLCHIADTAGEMRELVAKLMEMRFSENEIEKRRQVLSAQFNPEANARALMALIFN